jgi:hypothetical protein
MIPLVALALSSCRVGDYEAREPWRLEAEERCLAEKSVQSSAFIEPESAIEGGGACGMMHPFKVSAMGGGYIMVEPQATLACPIIGEVDHWLADSVQSAAATWFGEQVVEIKQISAYSCRPMNGQPGNNISEHAFGNALDVAMFKLASGREVKVKDGWKGLYEERGFLRQVLADACDRFTTVLGPGSNAFHYDHFHLDLARRASGQTYCNPAPERLPPPPISQGVAVARRPAPLDSMVVMHQSSSPQQRLGDLPLGPGPQKQMHEQVSRQSAGPMAVERTRLGLPADKPLSLTPSQQTPRTAAGPAMIEQQPVYRAPPDPNRPLPPRNVGAKLDNDTITTGSIGAKEVKRKVLASAPAPATNSGLMSPEPMANHKIYAKEPIEQATLRALKSDKN